MTSHSAARDASDAPRTGPTDRVARIRSGLLAAILEHRLTPGTKLGEDELGHIYNASRTLVRSALQQLAHEGIVVIEKNRGAFVASPTPVEALECFEARRVIEAALTERAVARRTPDWLARLDSHVAEEADAAARGDHRASIRLSGEFHLLVADMAGHGIFTTILRELVARSSLIILIYRSHRNHPCGPEHHRLIADAIRGGDAGRARRLMIDHLDEIEGELDLAEQEPQDMTLAQILGA